MYAIPSAWNGPIDDLKRQNPSRQVENYWRQNYSYDVPNE